MLSSLSVILVKSTAKANSMYNSFWKSCHLLFSNTVVSEHGFLIFYICFIEEYLKQSMVQHMVESEKSRSLFLELSQKWLCLSKALIAF